MKKKGTHSFSVTVYTLIISVTVGSRSLQLISRKVFLLCCGAVPIYWHASPIFGPYLLTTDTSVWIYKLADMQKEIPVSKYIAFSVYLTVFLAQVKCYISISFLYLLYNNAFPVC